MTSTSTRVRYTSGSFFTLRWGGRFAKGTKERGGNPMGGTLFKLPQWGHSILEEGPFSISGTLSKLERKRLLGKRGYRGPTGPLIYKGLKGHFLHGEGKTGRDYLETMVRGNNKWRQTRQKKTGFVAAGIKSQNRVASPSLPPHFSRSDDRATEPEQERRTRETRETRLTQNRKRKKR